MALNDEISTLDARNDETNEILNQIRKEISTYKGPKKTSDDLQRDALIGSLRKLSTPTESEQKLLTDLLEKQSGFAKIESEHHKKLRKLFTEVFDIVKSVMLGKVYMPHFKTSRILHEDANAAYLIEGIELGTGLNPSITLRGHQIGDFNSLHTTISTLRLFSFGPYLDGPIKVINGAVIEPDEYIKFMEARRAKIIAQMDTDLNAIKSMIAEYKQHEHDLNHF
jgi:hypothetical protein